VGVDADGKQPFAELRHAEEEARILCDRLSNLSNFDASAQRTRLITGATREEIKAAIGSLAAQKKADQKMLGHIDTIFLFYFTGHGLEGRLLLQDGPLGAAELGGLLKSVGADFTVGVFDACNSGSLSPKGILPTPGLNLFRELPEEVLAAEGSIWYVSSAPGQASYEDDQLGGIFTHFFIEALERAEPAGPGITLDRIWDYTRQHTVQYTAERNRRQVPQQHIANLTASAPIYFSFPKKRDATLVFSEGITGQFALSYAGGQLTELVSKTAGKRKDLAVYPGKAQLALLGKGKLVGISEITLTSGQALVLSTAPEAISPDPALGERSLTLWEKGAGGQTLIAKAAGPGVSLLGGAGYAYDLGPEDMLIPSHGLSAKLRLDYARIWSALSLNYGFGNRDLESWSYRVDAVGGELSGGYQYPLSRLFNLNAGIAAGAARLWQKYGDDTRREGWQIEPSVKLGALYHQAGLPFAIEITVSAGPAWSPGTGADADYFWYFKGNAGLSIYYRIQ
jgi:hypothetical protein